MENKQKIRRFFSVLVILMVVGIPKVMAAEIMLVNGSYPLPPDYAPPETVVYRGVIVSKEILGPLDNMVKAAKQEGIDLIITSGYRTYNYQQHLLDKKIRSLMNAGLAYEDALNRAKVEVAPPGTSEHQTGLAVDILSSDYSKLDERFAESEAGLWLKEHAPEYGFIQRYPKGKEAITGIMYEPWHYRYIGVEDALKIGDMCLEEYIETFPNRYNVRIVYNGKELPADAWMQGDTVYVPVRAFCESIGLAAEYADGKVKIVGLPVPAEIDDLIVKGDTAYAPIRKLAESMGLFVSWNQYTVGLAGSIYNIGQF